VYRGAPEATAAGTRCSIDRSAGERARRVRDARDYVLRACDASLLRLGVDVIDVIDSVPRPPPPQDVEIEETAGAGKVRHLGLSEVDGDLLCRAHPVHSENTLCTRDGEAVTPVRAEPGSGSCGTRRSSGGC